jgi:tRNA threonylcarbamoyl adenosine modification protein (Sua5/YciO/YrdC/YwlC family)
MAQFFSIHSEHPQPRLIKQAADIVRGGGLIAFPTDAAYALGGHTGDASLLARIRWIRQVDEHHHFTLMCRDLSEIASYARVDNTQYRFLKSCTPGAYTFILEGSRQLPRRVLHPKRKTIGIRVPAHALSLAMLEALGEPLLVSTLLLPDSELPLTDTGEIRQKLEHQVDLVIESGHCGIEMTTVIDLTDSPARLIRAGCGPLAPLGME